jgi:glycosyltransferase involved in cell wall biosynthesis
MHVLIATPEYPPHAGGGLLKFYALLAPALAAEGCRVTVLVANPLVPAFAPYERDGVAVRAVSDQSIRDAAERLPHFAAAPMLRRWLGAAAALADVARHENADVIEAVDFGLNFLPFAAGQDAGRLVVQMHGSQGQIAAHEAVAPRDELDAALAQLAECAGLPRAAELQACSPANAAEWTDRLARHVTFIPPTFPIAPDAVRTSTSGPALVVARVQHWKGPQIVCEAIRQLARRQVAFPIQWVGRDTATGPDGMSMAAYLAREYAEVWGTNITHLPQQPPDIVAEMQRAARVVIVPSLWDTLNFTVLEAMAAGKVVICSKGAGASWLIQHGINGFAVDADNPASLADAFDHVSSLSDAELNMMGSLARTTIAGELSIQRTVPTRLARYRHVAQASTDSGAADWLNDLFTPSARRTAGLDYLDGVALRRVAGYVARRLQHKLVPTGSDRP